MVCRGAVVLGDADAKLAEKQVALAAAKAQLTTHDKHLTSQDATIKGLLRKQASFICCLSSNAHKGVALTTTMLCTVGPARRPWSVLFEILAHKV